MRHRENRRRQHRHDDLNRGDYRGDFGAEGYRHFDAPDRHDEGHHGPRRPGSDREYERGRYGGWDRAGREGWHRGRQSGGFGSSYDAWSQGAGFETSRRGGFADEDWQPTRPARGRGVWAGDWENEEAARRDARQDHRGRGPRGYRRSDERIRDEVCERLTDDWSVDASDIDIQVQDGDVTLSGMVRSREQKRRAAECVEDVRGVHDVINQIRVRDERAIAKPGGAADRTQDVAADRGRRS